jgi:hypothetical protein
LLSFFQPITLSYVDINKYTGTTERTGGQEEGKRGRGEEGKTGGREEGKTGGREDGKRGGQEVIG